MSYGYFRLGANVPGKRLPPILNPMLVAPADLEPEMSTAPRNPVAPIEFEPGMSARDDARAKGYTGDTCDNCGSTRMLRTGHCNTCESCGTTTGCS